MKNNIRENSKDILKWWFMVRWFIIIILFSISIIRITEVKQITTIIFAAAFLAVVVLNIIFYLQVKQKNYLFTSLQIIFDVIFATIVVHITGGLDSSFVWIYLVPVITASLTVEALGGMISALIGSLSLLFLIITYKIGWLQPLNNINFEEVIPSELSIFLISYTGLFVSVAVLTSYMKDILKNENRLKTELKDEVHNLQEEIKSYQNKIS
ncbi:MAG: histidine kinase, partial [Candidatus Cloacimonetes bacterium]|nr:histidine kinase [Candidatus Cloacimonadota bacterium]